MELIRGLHNLRSRHRGCVATVGNYDGVHLGHQAVLGDLVERARAARVPSLAVVFEPTPQEFFALERAPARLTRFREKLEALAATGLDCLLCLRFDAGLAKMPAEEFIARILVAGLGVRYLVVGNDFRFGCERRGDFALLEHSGREAGFEVSRMTALELDGERVSSTRVREALDRGDLALARRLLGRDYRIIGRVRRGLQLGRTLGFPTVNIYLQRKATPVHGVFTVRVHGAAEGPVFGVANVGTRPTISGDHCLLEVYLLDFEGDLYGRHLEVDFLERLRDEERYPDLETLRAQIARDVALARERLTDY